MIIHLVAFFQWYVHLHQFQQLRNNDRKWNESKLLFFSSLSLFFYDMPDIENDVWKSKKCKHYIWGENVDRKEYDQMADELQPTGHKVKNGFNAFLYGGVMGVIAQGVLDFYMNILDVSEKDATPMLLVY